MEVVVRFPVAGRTVRVPRGTPLVDAVRAAGLPLASACGADGLCARCGVEVLDASAPLPAEGEPERRAKQRNRIAPGLRLACRLRADADLSLSAPYW